MAQYPPIYVLRHGQTEWNRAGRMQGVMDSPLTPLGQEQAKDMGSMLKQAGITVDDYRFLTSPQGRAQRTAELALAELGATAEQHPMLGEIAVGDWSGLTREEIDARWPSSDPHEHFLDFYQRAPGGDSFDDMWDRVGLILSELSGPTVIVTHGVTSRFLRTRAMGYPLSELAEVPGGQGVIHCVKNRVHSTLSSKN